MDSGQWTVDCGLSREQPFRWSFIVFYIEFHIKCSNEDIFVLHLANLHFLAYVRSGWWVGDVTQNNVRARRCFRGFVVLCQGSVPGEVLTRNRAMSKYQLMWGIKRRNAELFIVLIFRN